MNTLLMSTQFQLDTLDEDKLELLFSLSERDPDEYFTVKYEENNQVNMCIILDGEVRLFIKNITIENIDFEIPLLGLGIFYLDSVATMITDCVDYEELVELFYRFFAVLD